MYGTCRWDAGHSDVNVNVNQYNQWTAAVDRNATAERLDVAQGENQAWQHQVEHRQNVAYSDARVTQRYGVYGGQASSAARGLSYGSDGGRAEGQGVSIRADDSARDYDTERAMGLRSGTFHGDSDGIGERAISLRGADSRTSGYGTWGSSFPDGFDRTSGAVRGGYRRYGGRR